MAGAVVAALGTSTLDRRRMTHIRRELAELEGTTLEPARKAAIRSNLAYHLAGLQRSAAERLTMQAPFVPVFGAGVFVLAVGIALVAHRRVARARAAWTASPQTSPPRGRSARESTDC